MLNKTLVSSWNHWICYILWYTVEQNLISWDLENDYGKIRKYRMVTTRLLNLFIIDKAMYIYIPT